VGVAPVSGHGGGVGIVQDDEENPPKEKEDHFDRQWSLSGYPGDPGGRGHFPTR